MEMKETLMYFLNHPSIFIENCSIMTTQTWCFQITDQDSPGLRKWLCNQSRRSFGNKMETNGNKWNEWKLSCISWTIHPFSLKIAAPWPHKPGVFKSQIRITLNWGSGSVIKAEGPLEQNGNKWQQMEWMETLMNFLNHLSVFIENCSIMTTQTWSLQKTDQDNPGLRKWLCSQSRRSFGNRMETNGNKWKWMETLMYFLNLEMTLPSEHSSAYRGAIYFIFAGWILQHDDHWDHD